MSVLSISDFTSSSPGAFLIGALCITFLIRGSISGGSVHSVHLVSTLPRLRRFLIYVPWIASCWEACPMFCSLLFFVFKIFHFLRIGQLLNWHLFALHFRCSHCTENSCASLPSFGFVCGILCSLSMRPLFEASWQFYRISCGSWPVCLAPYSKTIFYLLGVWRSTLHGSHHSSTIFRVYTVQLQVFYLLQ